MSKSCPAIVSVDFLLSPDPSPCLLGHMMLKAVITAEPRTPVTARWDKR